MTDSIDDAKFNFLLMIAGGECSVIIFVYLAQIWQTPLNPIYELWNVASTGGFVPTCFVVGFLFFLGFAITGLGQGEICD
jgi:hypothetical protein